MSDTMNVVETRKKIHEVSAKSPTPKVVTSMRATPRGLPLEDGTLPQGAPQGDLACIAVTPGTLETAGPYQGWQLAPGLSRGSRHTVAEGSRKHVQLFTIKGAGALDGPLVVAGEPWTLEHPEHGPWTLPAGEYRVRYQADLRFQTPTRLEE